MLFCSRYPHVLIFFLTIRKITYISYKTSITASVQEAKGLSLLFHSSLFSGEKRKLILTIQNLQCLDSECYKKQRTPLNQVCLKGIVSHQKKMQIAEKHSVFLLTPNTESLKTGLLRVQCLTCHPFHLAQNQIIQSRIAS